MACHHLLVYFPDDPSYSVHGLIAIYPYIELNLDLDPEGYVAGSKIGLHADYLPCPLCRLRGVAASTYRDSLG